MIRECGCENCMRKLPHDRTKCEGLYWCSRCGRIARLPIHYRIKEPIWSVPRWSDAIERALIGFGSAAMTRAYREKYKELLEIYE